VRLFAFGLLLWGFWALGLLAFWAFGFGYWMKGGFLMWEALEGENELLKGKGLLKENC
jgi:hypothetical protein